MMETYNKCQVKKDYSSGKFQKDEKENPVLGDIIKSGIRFESHHARVLNVDWEDTGIFYQKVEDKPKEQDLNDLTKPQLIYKCKELELDETGNKDVLIKRIEDKLKQIKEQGE